MLAGSFLGRGRGSTYTSPRPQQNRARSRDDVGTRGYRPGWVVGGRIGWRAGLCGLGEPQGALLGRLGRWGAAVGGAAGGLIGSQRRPKEDICGFVRWVFGKDWYGSR